MLIQRKKAPLTRVGLLVVDPEPLSLDWKKVAPTRRPERWPELFEG
jgi:hypothetical protein